MNRFPSLLSTLLLCGMATAQTAPAPSPAAAHQTTQGAAKPAGAPSAQQAPPQAQLMLANADKLVALAQQLKSEVDKTNEYTLSLNTLRRAEDVEKLAKDLQKQLQHSRK